MSAPTYKEDQQETPLTLDLLFPVLLFDYSMGVRQV